MHQPTNSKIWQHPWSYREGFAVTISIILLGFILQAISQNNVVLLVSFPKNLLAGLVFLAAMTISFFLWKKHPVMRWLGTVNAALPAILGYTLLALLLGLVKQDTPTGNPLIQLLGINHLVQTWPFILMTLYLLILLGIVTLKRLRPFTLRNFGFFLNHAGLFLVLFASALGSSDVQQLKMNCYENQTEWRAIDDSGQIVEVPFAVKLLDFKIDEFRPKVLIIDNQTGLAISGGKENKPEILDRASLDLPGYHLEVEQFLESSVKDSNQYVTSNATGAAPAAKIKITNTTNHAVINGWIFSGSYLFPGENLKLSDQYSLSMLPPEPRKYSSELNIHTAQGQRINTTIEVNRPYKINGWTIYQLSYNPDMGRWSNLSVLQLVRDPWLPAVFTGIFFMMAGAIFLFIVGKPKNGGTEHVA